MPRRLALFSLWLAMVVTGAVGCDDARQAGSVSWTTTSVAVASEECKPAFLSLPALDGHQQSRVTAMNDAGLAVGYSGGFDDSGEFFYRSVMWGDDGAAIDLGIGGGLGAGNIEVRSAAVDVNEQGEVVSQSFYGEGKAFVKSSWLWRDGVKVRLRATEKFPWTNVEALNDLSVAVGWLEAHDGRYRPSAWVDGKPVPLPIPEGAMGMAQAINNNNLIVGWVLIDASDSGVPWFWRFNGRSGPLPTRPSGQSGGAFEVNNNNQILGSTGGTGVVWPAGPSSTPYSYGGAAVSRAADMNDHGDLTGSRGGSRDNAGDAWVSRIGAKKAVDLPDPLHGGGVNGGESFGMAVIRGFTWFAPDGGVSVGGAAGDGDDWHAMIWTCTQTYRH